MTQLSENANKYAMAALRERRAEMSGELTRLERQVRHLKASMVHMDATLRLMDPDRDPNESKRVAEPTLRGAAW